MTLTYTWLILATVGAIILILVTIADRKYIANLRSRNENQRELLAAERRVSEAHAALNVTVQDLADSRKKTLDLMQTMNRLLIIENDTLAGVAVPVSDDIKADPKPEALKPINLTCPYCGARPGESCVTAKGQPGNLHRAARKQRVEGA